MSLQREKEREIERGREREREGRRGGSTGREERGWFEVFSNIEGEKWRK